MNPEQAKFLAATLGQQLQQEWMTTYKVIAAIPEGKKDWKPETNSRTAWELARHIAEADVGFLAAAAANSLAAFPAQPVGTTVAELASWYKHEFPKGLEKVLALDGGHLAQIVDAWGMQIPSVSLLIFCNNHMIHHRGQLATYLRPMGGKVPAIYGGSFDEGHEG